MYVLKLCVTMYLYFISKYVSIFLFYIFMQYLLLNLIMANKPKDLGFLV